jgi:exodeoxyribonuclease V alpha subunit
LLSPTGKAAKRLAEATLRDGHTIHCQLFSLHRQRVQTKPKSRGPEVELYLPAEAVIIDEASMVDLPLLAWLLGSVGAQTRLIFVGDKDQLASVGPGSVLRVATRPPSIVGAAMSGCPARTRTARPPQECLLRRRAH